MLTSKKIIVDVYDEQPISEEQVAKAVSAFRYENVDHPDTLALGYEAYHELCKEASRTWLDIKQYRGLKIYLDPMLSPPEWRVRKEKERVEKVSANHV